jgi:hypothetical protein
MKRRLAIILIALFTAGAGADDVYRGLADRSPDLQEPHTDSVVSDRLGVADRNPDRLTGTGYESAAYPSGGNPSYDGAFSGGNRSIYGGFCGGSDIPC